MITSSVAVGDIIIISIIIPHMSCISFNCNDIKIARDGALMWWPRKDICGIITIIILSPTAP